LPNPINEQVQAVLRAKCKQVVNKGFQVEQKEPLPSEALASLLSTCGNSPTDIRDAAIIWMGFASGGRRRSEIASAHISDVSPLHTPENGFGYIFSLRNSKGNDGGLVQDYPFFFEAAEAVKNGSSSLITRELIMDLCFVDSPNMGL
jgi:hypothetical protein